MEFPFFLLQVLVISPSGAVAPGPGTAAAIGMGSRNRFAGVLMALGHGIVEFPLMVLLIFGVGRWLEMPSVRMVIGLAGGGFLLFMAVQMFRGLGDVGARQTPAGGGSPLVAGVLL